jgi:hypothetical protein
MHIDWVAAGPPGEVGRLGGLGAAVMAEHVLPGVAWSVLGDPEGTRFCVSGHG